MTQSKYQFSGTSICRAASSTLKPPDMGAHPPEALGGDATPRMKAPETDFHKWRIEIMAEMIRAGDLALASHDPSLESEEDCLARIYREMDIVKRIETAAPASSLLEPPDVSAQALNPASPAYEPFTLIGCDAGCTMVSGGWPGPQSRDRRPNLGSVSLCDMINASVHALCSLCAQLRLEELLGEDLSVTSVDVDAPIDEATKRRAENMLIVANDVADKFEMTFVHDRIVITKRKLQAPISHRDLSTELRVLREAVHSALQNQSIYRYPIEKSRIRRAWQTDWADVIDAFPSAKEDVFAAVDLWALDHPTACVFHLMRVLEHGLRALAADLGKTFDVQNWQNIIEQIEAEIRVQGKTLLKGAARSERLKFLSEAAKEFVYFKDGWRNHVSHNRSSYDEVQASVVLEHVQTFMNVLSSKLGE